MASVFSIVGRSETGKTTLITRLVGELKRRGISVAVIKHCPRGFDLDRKGKDSWRFREAGADGVFLLSPERLAMIGDVKEKLALNQIVQGFLGNVELVLTEGYPDGERRSKIEVLRSSVSQELLSAPDELSALVADFEVGLDLPQFGHEDIPEIVDFLEGSMTKEEERPVFLRVNGKDVDLNPFVQNMLKNTVTAMVSSLRIEEKPEIVELRVSLKETQAQ